MDIKQVSYPDLAFVDIETTGSHFNRDRITEIGIKTLASNQIQVWEQLINPQTLCSQYSSLCYTWRIKYWFQDSIYYRKDISRFIEVKGLDDGF